MLLLLGGHNCIHGITYKVLSNIKLKWLHTPCTSPSEPCFPLRCLLSPFAVKFTLKCEKRDMATDTCWILSASGAAVAPPKSACHFYPIYSSPGLIACFLSEEIFPVKALYSSFISLFPAPSPWKGFDMHLSRRQAFYTLPLTSRSGSSKLLRAHKSNPAELLWCHYSSLKSLLPASNNSIATNQFASSFI